MRVVMSRSGLETKPYVIIKERAWSRVEGGANKGGQIDQKTLYAYFG